MDKQVYLIQVLFHVHRIQSIGKLEIVRIMFYHEVVRLKLIFIERKLKIFERIFRRTYDNEQWHWLRINKRQHHFHRLVLCQLEIC